MGDWLEKWSALAGLRQLQNAQQKANAEKRLVFGIQCGLTLTEGSNKKEGEEMPPHLCGEK